jgi:tetratricopeptide (TPR) repeat protein
MRDDKEHPDGFNPLVKMLVTEDEFFQQIKRLSNDEILSGIHDALTDRPLNATILAERLCDLADKLVINVDPKTDPKDKVKEKYEEIITTYQIAMRLDPGLKRAYHGYAEACLEMGYYAQCIEAYQTLLKKNSEATDVLLDLGFAYLRMNHLKEASECFRKVLDLSTDPIERRRANEGLNDIARRGG